MVADVCDDDDDDDDDRANEMTISVVWEDGSEEDGLPLSAFGPTWAGGVISSKMKAQEVRSIDAMTEASDARERGNARFRDGHVAAAAAEYVEACAWLVSALSANARMGVLPGEPREWFIPDATANVVLTAAAATGGVDAAGGGVDGDGGDDTRPASDNVTAAAATSSSSTCRPTVGSRVRVLGSDGTSRAGMVSYIETDEELCDVMFDEEDENGEDEEVGVPFDRIYVIGGGSGCVGGGSEGEQSGRSERRERYPAAAEEEEEGEDDDGESARRRRRREAEQKAAAEIESTMDVLAGCLHNVARCHLRLHAKGGGGSISAVACAAAATAALSLRRSAVAFYLRGRARTALNKFRLAGEDLKAALALEKSSLSTTTRPIAEGGGDKDDDEDDDDDGINAERQEGLTAAENELYEYVRSLEDEVKEEEEEEEAEKTMKKKKKSENNNTSSMCISDDTEGDGDVVVNAGKDDNNDAVDSSEQTGGIVAAVTESALIPTTTTTTAGAATRTGVEREIRVAMRDLKKAAKDRAASDRRLARAFMGHMRATEVVDFGLDPGSHLERYGYLPQPPVEPAHRKKGGVPLDQVGDVVRERVRAAREKLTERGMTKKCVVQ